MRQQYFNCLPACHIVNMPRSFGSSAFSFVSFFHEIRPVFIFQSELIIQLSVWIVSLLDKLVTQQITQLFEVWVVIYKLPCHFSITDTSNYRPVSYTHL